ncbi:PREDICTED: uncharacterized protein LOC104817760 [Tarenaya hassleriana]|uniref:uncharacterized protein LOC104817760 n=1 Tax=Tarenaya hassleriana TaxID=28532 RepID=UPI00053C7E65|nr:PREDICTED: uncharacterized protein LOC104817760 [Tarenaya hassleriana]
MEAVVATVASWFTPTTLFLFLNLMIGTIVITSRFGSVSKKNHPPVNPSGSGHTHHHAPLARAPSLVDRVKSINFHLYKFPSPETELFATHLDETGSDPHPDPDPHPLARAPSLLGRVKSINLSYFKFPPYHPENDYAPTTPPEDDNPFGSTRLDSTDPAQIKTPENDEHRDVPGPGPELSDPAVPSRLARAPSLLERVKSIKFSPFHRSDPTHVDYDPVSPDDDHKSRGRKPETTSMRKMTKSASEKQAEETAEEVERRRPETMRVERSTSFDDEEGGVDAKATDFISKFKQQLKLQRLDSFLRYKEMLKSN